MKENGVDLIAVSFKESIAPGRWSRWASNRLCSIVICRTVFQDEIVMVANHSELGNLLPRSHHLLMAAAY